MELNQYWFLYCGLLLLFLSSRVGKVICLRACMTLCACFCLTAAIILSAILWILRSVDMLLWWIRNTSLKRYKVNWKRQS